MAKVSIILPIYNVEMYLDECLESVKRQTLKDIEIICVNDGSIDGSPDIIKKYAEGDDRFVIIDKENGGYGKGMNVGLDAATGEYIGIVEPDDYVPLNMYEDLYNVAVKNDLDFVKADFYRFTTDKDTKNMQLVYNHLDKSGEYYNQVLNPSEMPLLTNFILNTWSGIYRRSFIEEHHIRHNETPGASFQDNGFFWQTFIYAKRAMFLDKPYYMNRRDNPNSSVKDKNKVYSINIEYDFVRDILMKKGNEDTWERFKGYYNKKRYINYKGALDRIGDEYKQEYVDRISKELKRAEEMGEIDWTIFSDTDRKSLLLLIKSPNEYYLNYCIKKKDQKSTKAEKKLAEIENSTTYKVGKAVMFIPIKIKKLCKRKK